MYYKVLLGISDVPPEIWLKIKKNPQVSNSGGIMANKQTDAYFRYKNKYHQSLIWKNGNIQ